MPYGTVILDGSVTNAKIADGSVTNTKIAAGTISGDRLAAGLNYAGDLTVQQFCANKCLCPAITGYSCCCYGGYFYGNCGICVSGTLIGAMICGGLCVTSSGSVAACVCSICGTALSAMTTGPSAGSFMRSLCSCCCGCGCTSETESVSISATGWGLCACYFCCDGCSTSRSSYAQLAFGDYGVYTPNKAYMGGGLILAGNAGSVEGSISICAGCMCYYSSGVWHPLCKVC